MSFGSHSKNILLLQNCFRSWRREKHLSYTLHGFGFEEGLKSHGSQVTIITNPWFRHARELCAGQKYDQIWINDLANLQIDPKDLHYFLGSASKKVGIIAESLEYHESEYSLLPHLRQRKQKVKDLLPNFTHVLAVDERDVQELSDEFKNIKLKWLHGAVPRRCIDPNPPQPNRGTATFSGSVYGPRREWMKNSSLRQQMRNRTPSESSTLIPTKYNALSLWSLGQSRLASDPHKAYQLYLKQFRSLKRQSFDLWLKDMQWGCAVVNLPSFYKGFPGRVYESIAAGRPLISWRIPDRPHTSELFAENQEILFFDHRDPESLSKKIRLLQNDSNLASSIVLKAQKKLLTHHTMEYRTQEILEWIN